VKLWGGKMLRDSCLSKSIFCQSAGLVVRDLLIASL
jgi:hypothetical protein